MGTRADFYIGEGESAEWLGSIPFDGFPDSIPSCILRCGDAEWFKTHVNSFLGEVEGSTTKEMGWPWPWKTSATTDYTYALIGRKVMASCFGGPWFDPLQTEPDHENEEQTVVFPVMDTSKHARAGDARSGILLIQGRE